MASARRSFMLTAAALLALFGVIVIRQHVSDPLAAGALAAAQTFATLALAAAVASWLDRRTIGRVAQRVDDNHRAVVREVSLLRWRDRDRQDIAEVVRGEMRTLRRTVVGVVREARWQGYGVGIHDTDPTIPVQKPTSDLARFQPADLQHEIATVCADPRLHPADKLRIVSMIVERHRHEN